MLKKFTEFSFWLSVFCVYVDFVCLAMPVFKPFKVYFLSGILWSTFGAIYAFAALRRIEKT